MCSSGAAASTPKPTSSKTVTVTSSDRNRRRWVRGRRHRRRRRRRNGATALMYAAQQGDVDCVRHIVRFQPFALLDRDRTGKSALHYCCCSDRVWAAQAADLLTMAAPDLVEARDEDGFTPLHLAVIAGNTQLVTFLLANGADVGAVDNEKHTVVHWATVCGETTALRAVLAAGAPVSTPDVHGGYPLHYAAQMCGGDKDSILGLQVLQILLYHKDIKVSVEDGDKRQPLLWAASAGSSKAILALVRAGALVESSDKDGLTALHCAASRGHTDCIDTLLTLCGANADVIDSNGCTALHYAVTLGHADATALLLAHGADPNRQDRKGRSPAHCGCAKGQFETVKLIASRGANLWLRNARGDLPLHEAANSGRRELVSWLLSMRPSQVNARNNDGRCPLHMAALNDNTDMCKILLDSGAQINPILRTSKNVFMTPLDCALQRGFRSTAKFLQLHGGVPASRAGNQIPVPSHGSFPIRDDTTFASSSESEREKVGTSNSARKSPMRKQKKKLPGQSEVSRLETQDQKTQTTGSLEESTNPSSSKIDYSNEIIINGKTEINIHQVKEITLEPGGSATSNVVAIDSSEKISIPIRSASGNKERRPKSAKYSIIKEKHAPKGSKSVTPTLGASMDHKDSFEADAHKTSASESEMNTTDKVKPDDQASNTNEEIEEVMKINEIATESSEGKSEPGIEKPSEELSVETKPEENKLSEIEPSQHFTDMKEIESQADVTEHEEGLERQSEHVIEASGEKVDLDQTVKEESEDLAPAGQSEGTIDHRADSEAPIDVLAALVTKELNEVNGEVTLEEVGEKEANKALVEGAEAFKEEGNEPVGDDQDKREAAAEHELQIITSNQMGYKSDEKNESNGFEHKSKRRPVTKLRGKPRKKGNSKAYLALEQQGFGDIVSSSEETGDVSDSLLDDANKVHKSFKVLSDKEVEAMSKFRPATEMKIRSKSREARRSDKTKPKQSKIPTPTFRTHLSKSERQLDRLEADDARRMEPKVPSLPDIHRGTNSGLNEPQRPDSILSAPIRAYAYSDVERGTESDIDDKERSSPTRRKKIKRKSRMRHRESRSAGSDYESSNLIDSGFEPSPRSTRISKWRNMSDRGVTMTSVTKTIQTNIRRYHLERKLFQHLLELKRSQIRADQHNESVLVKRAIDQYNRSCASTVGAGRYVPHDFTFRSFEKFLYESLRKLQKIDVAHLRGLPESAENVNPLLCTQSTHRCMHATHAYTGIPCAAYLPKMDHHSIPKIGFDSVGCKPGTAGFLPKIIDKKAVTLELSHGPDKQIISLPTDRLDQNKRYYVTFTVKGQDASTGEENGETGHTHPKSD
ncbi:ankycorbin [Cylas formicarius]|uniref:ankycorbin n=1 Tax=Cylas formicarius TaxID=197179 RepID=UPI00295831CA|nr:ankycorbin [Cylas formicarius]